MDEFAVVLKARKFVSSVGVDRIPVDLEPFAKAANATIKKSDDLFDEESGQTFPVGDTNVITVNRNHREERQRFTVLHEIAHIILKLPSQHHGNKMTTSDLVSYRRRPKEEVLCDVFASECLLPYEQFKSDVNDSEVSLASVQRLATRYKASVTATGSRFAVNCSEPCAFVLMEDGRIRYVSSSKHLRERNGWIDFGVALPKGSVAERLVGEGTIEGYDELPTAIWFSNGVRGYDYLTEEAMRITEWDQCLSLLWFDDDPRPNDQAAYSRTEEDEPLLEELDGVLPWPGKRKRK